MQIHFSHRCFGTKIQWRIEQFLGGKFNGKLPMSNTQSSSGKVKVVSDNAREILDEYFEEKNEELYQFLEENPGPWMEQRPFPHFQ